MNDFLYEKKGRKERMKKIHTYFRDKKREKGRKNKMVSIEEKANSLYYLATALASPPVLINPP